MNILITCKCRTSILSQAVPINCWFALFQVDEDKDLSVMASVDLKKMFPDKKVLLLQCLTKLYSNYSTIKIILHYSKL